MKIKYLFISLALIISYIVFFLFGYYGYYVSNKGDLALGSVINDVSTLSYIEDKKIEEASEFLRRQIEVNIATAINSGAIGAESNDANAWIKQYARFYEKYPKLDHPYDPEIREAVDSLYQ